MTALKKWVVAAITWEARLMLRRCRPKIIAVTGSVGKTTTKDAIFAALSGELHVRKSAKSFNSDIGVPLTILGLDNAWNNPVKWAYNIALGAWRAAFAARYPAWLVLEVGADRPGDIQRIARWLRPNITVITGVPDIPSHIEYFRSPAELLKEKRALAEHLRPGGKLVLNGDDEALRELRTEFRGPSLTYGLEADDEFYASHVEIDYESELPVGMRFRVEHAGFSVPVSIRGALGTPRVYAALAAFAVGDIIGIDSVSVSRALAEWEAPPGRLRIIAGKAGSVLIDDTYNSSPAAARAALELLDSVRAKRRIALLGDMLELGKYTKDAHRELGIRAAAVADRLATVGIRAKTIAEAAREAGMADDAVQEYDANESERLGHDLAPKLTQGDVVLVKGSQGIRMEKTVRALMAEPDRAAELLVRMESDWKAR